MIQNNAINGGAAPTDTTYAILIATRAQTPGKDAGGMITGNTIQGGDGQVTRGIAAFRSADSMLVSGNFINAGSSTPGAGATNADSWAIEVGAVLVIDANRINDPNKAPTIGTCALLAPCGGIKSDSSLSVIRNNVVYGMKASTSAAIALMQVEGPVRMVQVNGNYLDGAGMTAGNVVATVSAAILLHNNGGQGPDAVVGRIRNDILIGGVATNRYGVYEDQTPGNRAHPEAIEFDDFFFAQATVGQNSALYHLWDGAAAKDLIQPSDVVMSVPTTPPPAQILNQDPLIDYATMELQTKPSFPNDSPMIDVGTATEAPARDFQGVTRPQRNGIDIGHDEAE
jgi:hypothetical protein